MKKYCTKSELFSALIDKKEDAIEQLFYEVHPRLCEYCMRLVKDKQAADAAATDAILKCLKYIKNRESYKYFIIVLFIAAKQLSLDYLNAEKKFKAEPFDETLFDIKPDNATMNEIIHNDLISTLRKEISGYDNVERLIIDLSYLQGWNKDDLADVLKINKNTLGNEKSKGAKKLRDFLKRNGFGFLFF